MAKNKNTNTTKYIYGSVAYDLEPSAKPQRQKKAVVINKNSNKNKLRLMSKILLVFVLSFLLVGRFTSIMRLTYDIRATKSEIAKINDDNENIKIKLALINNIKNIDKIAVEKCGMITPVASQVKYVNVKPLTLSSEKYTQSAFQMIQRLLGLIY